MSWKSELNPKMLWKTLGMALLFATIFRSFFFQPFVIPSESMLPTLIVGDRILVQKFSYGYSKYSFPLNMIPFSGKILQFHQPKHGDVVVFKMPEKGNEYFIKRVIGVPGDVISIKNGVVSVNNRANSLEYVRTDEMPIGAERVIDSHMYQEKNQEGKAYYIYRFSRNGAGFDDNLAPVKVPAGHYFMMGDNRNNSQDSRYADMGFVSGDKIVGNARIIWLSSPGNLYEFWKWGQLDFSRIATRLDK